MIRFARSFDRFVHYGSLRSLRVLFSGWLSARLAPSYQLIGLQIVWIFMLKEKLFARKVMILLQSTSLFARLIQCSVSQVALPFLIDLIKLASSLITFFLWMSNDFPSIFSEILLEFCWTIEYFRVISWVLQFVFRVGACSCFVLSKVVQFADL